MASSQLNFQPGDPKPQPRAARRPHRTRIAPPTESSRSLLASLGVFGMEGIEPVVLGALIAGDPLLLIGPHGTGKSYLLNRVARALGMEWRHYNASLLNYDDLVGYPPGTGRSRRIARSTFWPAVQAGFQMGLHA
jgi:MoxR-like ATPase